jgi:hypothetical protein
MRRHNPPFGLQMTGKKVNAPQSVAMRRQMEEPF